MARQKSISRRKFLDAAGLASVGILTSPHVNSALAKTAQGGSPQARTPDQTRSIMSRLSSFIANTRYDSLPPKAIETAKVAIMDCWGVAIAGGREESAQISGKLIREERAKAETTI